MQELTCRQKRGARAQMYCYFDRARGQVISGGHTTFTHSEGPLRVAIDLEE